MIGLDEDKYEFLSSYILSSEEKQTYLAQKYNCFKLKCNKQMIGLN